MKHFYQLFLCFCLSLLCSELHAQLNYTTIFDRHYLSLSTIQGPDSSYYTKVELAGAESVTQEEGKPELPVRTIRLMIPYGTRVNGITLSSVVTRNYYVSNWVFPLERHESMTPMFVEPDSSVYYSNQAFPANPVIEFRQGYFDGNNNIVAIDFCPFEYHPATGLLKMITSVTLTVNYSEGDRGGIPNITRLQKTQDMYDALLYDLVDNPDSIASFRISPNIVNRLDTTDTGLPVYEYVVIAPEIYRDTIHDFIDWKRQKGNWAGFVSLEQILAKYPDGDLIGTYPIEDTPGSMRQFLHDSYSKGTSYAFIVGVNSSEEQLRFASFVEYSDTVDYQISPFTTSDWYFNDLTGDWNVDGDEFFGEIFDDLSSNMWSLHVGRLLCSSPTEFGNWMRKLFVYEKNPGLGYPSYLTESIMTVDTSFIRKALSTESFLPSAFRDTMIVSDTSSIPIHPTGAEVINALNAKSYGIMFWHNHGGTNEYHSGILVSSKKNPLIQWKLVAEDAHDHQNWPETGNGLDNIVYRNTPFVICSESCSVIPFEKNRATSPIQRRNLGESFTVGNYGGVAFLGFCIDNGSGNNCVEFSKELNISQIGVTHAQLGSICERIKIQNISWKYNLNLIGDPECQIWTAIPTALQMTVQSTGITEFVKNEVSVTVGGIVDREKARVTLYSENDIFQTMEVTAGDPVALFDSVFPVTDTPITVTVTSLNHLPQQSLLPVISPCFVQITNDTTWATNFTTSCDYFIQSGATLTVSSEVGFGPDCMIQVLPGGKLILDGGRLYCSTTGWQWQGVRVIGQGGSGIQAGVLGQYQGLVRLQNNATIQDARVAVDLWDGIHLNTTGGIVIAEDATFLNNGIAVRAQPFKSLNVHGNEVTYAATFQNCDFTVNSSYPSNGEVFRHHVTLTKVKGVVFRGCSFLLQNCPPGLCASDNAAIFTYNAGIDANRYCSNPLNNTCPDPDYVYNSFNGFYMGINAVATEETSAEVTVRNSHFLNNTFGIRSLGGTTPTVLFNEFVVGGNGQCGVGVFMDGTPLFCIEENTFTKSANAPQGTDCIGVVVDNSKSENLVYRNTFTNLTCANLSLEMNWVQNNNRSSGLEYQCNQNSGNEIDFYVPVINNFQQPIGINPSQGSRFKAAGNTFSQNGVTYQFYNGKNEKVDYYYNQNNPYEEPQVGYYYGIKKQATTYSNSCAAHYTNGGGTPVLNPSDRAQREADYYESYGRYSDIKAIYESYIDGGSTEDELRDIATATSNNAWNLRNQLLRHSPYLSQRSMRAVAGRGDILAPSEIFEILASNPEELGRDSLLSYLEGLDEPLPGYYLDILTEVANGYTLRSALESEMSGYHLEFSQAAAAIVRSVMNDSVTDPQELREWLGRMENINADRYIISSYLSEGNDSAAFALAGLLPELYGLQGEDLREHDGYMMLLHLRDNLAKQGRTEVEMTDAEKWLVDSIAAYGTGASQTLAKGYLEVVRGITTTSCPEIDVQNGRGTPKGNIGIMSEEMAWAKGLRVTVSPIPARSRTFVEYSLPEGESRAVLTVVGPKGDVVGCMELNGGSGRVELDLSELSRGVYVYAVECHGLKATGKIILE